MFNPWVGDPQEKEWATHSSPAFLLWRISWQRLATVHVVTKICTQLKQLILLLSLHSINWHTWQRIKFFDPQSFQFQMNKKQMHYSAIQKSVKCPLTFHIGGIIHDAKNTIHHSITNNLLLRVWCFIFIYHSPEWDQSNQTRIIETMSLGCIKCIMRMNGSSYIIITKNIALQELDQNQTQGAKRNRIVI